MEAGPEQNHGAPKVSRAPSDPNDPIQIGRTSLCVLKGLISEIIYSGTLYQMERRTLVRCSASLYDSELARVSNDMKQNAYIDYLII